MLKKFSDEILWIWIKMDVLLYLKNSIVCRWDTVEANTQEVLKVPSVSVLEKQNRNHMTWGASQQPGERWQPGFQRSTRGFYRQRNVYH